MVYTQVRVVSGLHTGVVYTQVRVVTGPHTGEGGVWSTHR